MIDVVKLKRQVDLEDFAQQKYKLVFDSRGRGRCYFTGKHKNGDADPSLHLDRQKGRIRCHSQGCFGDKGADVIDLVQKIEGIGFGEAAEQIASWAGVHQMVRVELSSQTQWSSTQ